MWQIFCVVASHGMSAASTLKARLPTMHGSQKLRAGWLDLTGMKKSPSRVKRQSRTATQARWPGRRTWSVPGETVSRVAPDNDASAPERRIMRWLFVATSCALLLVHNGGVSGLDGETMFRAAQMAVDHQRVDVGPGFNSLAGINAHQYSRANIGLPLLAGLVYLLMAPVTWLAPGYSDFIRTAAVGAIMPLLCAGIVVAVYQLSRSLGARVSAALIVAIGTVGGTYLLPYSKEFFAEPLAALGIVIAVERALVGRPLAAGGGLAIAVLARAQSLLLIPIVLSVVVYRRGVRGGITALGPLCVAIALTVAYNIARFGNPLYFGYQDLGFSTPYLRGVGILLLSPKSLFLFAPVAVLLPWVFVAFVAPKQARCFRHRGYACGHAEHHCDVARSNAAAPGLRPADKPASCQKRSLIQ